MTEVNETKVSQEPAVATVTPVKSIAVALSKAQALFPPIQKNRTAKIKTRNGQEYSYKYADLTDVVAAVRPVLAQFELAFSQCVIAGPKGEELWTTLYHASGETITGAVPFVDAEGNGPQAVGSSLTYSRRYGLSALLGIVADEDDDGGAGGGKGENKPRTAPPKGNASTPPPNSPQPAKKNEPPKGVCSEAQRKKLRAQWGDLERTQDQWKMMLMKRFKKDSSTKLTTAEASTLITELNKEIEVRDGLDQTGGAK